MHRHGTILLLIVTISCFGQGKLITSVPLNGKVHFAGVDRPGDLYVVMEDGLTKKFDLNGVEIASKKFASPPTLFDPRDGTQSFAWFRDQRKLEYLTPDMSSSTEKQLPSEFTVYPWQVCPSKNELWILDSADMSLMQTTGRSEAVGYVATWQGSRPAATSIVFMREYQNFLFLLNKQDGILMFNNLGKQIRQMPVKDLKYFNFLGEELYYVENQTIKLMDLYTGEARELPLPHPSRFVLLTDLRMILVSDEKIEFLEFIP